jgi:hypothetical protein
MVVWHRKGTSGAGEQPIQLGNLKLAFSDLLKGPLLRGLKPRSGGVPIAVV